MPAQTLAAAALLASMAVNGNRAELRLDRGAAEIGFVSHSTFRLRHSLEGPLAPVGWKQKEKVDLQALDTPAAVTFRTMFLEVSIQKHGLLVTVKRASGEPLMRDLTEARRDGFGVSWERAAPPAARFYGLGPRADNSYDLRGRVVTAGYPFLVTTAGYGEYHAAPGPHTFDLAASDPGRYRIQTPAVDYYFFFGPAVKEIFEEAVVTRGSVTPSKLAVAATGTWDTLRDLVRKVTQASMSGMLLPAVDLTPYANAPPALAERARQFAQIAPGLVDESSALTPFRRQLTSFFATYAEEARDRGFPFFHPLPFQFQEDPAGVVLADQFMLGDEMLVAPICTPSDTRQVYLPRGIWTNWHTGETMPGRRTITVRSQQLPLFARNGTIVPLDPLQTGDPMLLHYFPSLGAEFFLLERDLADWSQVHAAPAADIMRLEIESKVERLYQWVVHHVPRPVRVEFESRRYAEVASPAALHHGAWWYDRAAKNLHIRVQAAAGSDMIVNVIAEEE